MYTTYRLLWFYRNVFMTSIDAGHYYIIVEQAYVMSAVTL